MKKIILSVLVLSTLAIIGCKKQEVIPPPVSTSELGSYFNDNVTNAKQNLSLNAASGGVLTGQNGVVINVPANAFVYSNGIQVTGSINFELIEALSISEMILLDKPTTSNNEILVSGGQIKLTATQNSSQVFLANGMSVNVNVPTSNPDGQMGLFTGTENIDGDVNWVSASLDTVQQDTVTIVTDSVSFDTYYNFDFEADSLGWINCDYFWNNPNPNTEVIAQLDTVYNASNTSCFLVFESINSVISLYPNNSILGEFFGYSAPTGEAVTFVCISERDGVYYSAFVNSTLVTNHIEAITMNQTTLQAIETAIDNL